MSAENVTKLPTKLGAGEALVNKDSYKDEAWWRWDAMIKGGAVSKTETPATCIAKAAYGELYAWNPILAVNRIYLVDGRPCLAAEAMVGLVRERMPQAQIVKVHHDATRCVIKGKRDREDEDWHVCEFTIEDAHAAGLAKKNNWRSYPKAMLWARCASMLTRELFSDVTLGAHTPDEIEGAPSGRVRQVGPQAMEFDEPADTEPEIVVDTEPNTDERVDFDDQAELADDWDEDPT